MKIHAQKSKVPSAPTSGLTSISDSVAVCAPFLLITCSSTSCSTKFSSFEEYLQVINVEAHAAHWLSDGTRSNNNVKLTSDPKLWWLGNPLQRLTVLEDARGSYKPAFFMDRVFLVEVALEMLRGGGAAAVWWDAGGVSVVSRLFCASKSVVDMSFFSRVIFFCFIIAMFCDGHTLHIVRWHTLIIVVEALVTIAKIKRRLARTGVALVLPTIVLSALGGRLINWGATTQHQPLYFCLRGQAH